MMLAILIISVWPVVPVVLAVVIARRNQRRNPAARFGAASLFGFFLLPCAAATIALGLAVASIWDPANRDNALLVAGVFTAIAVATGVLPWAFLGRIEGRNCPKCRYDMSGVGEMCPECGFTSERERDFHPPRRRWRAMAITLTGLVLMLSLLVGILAASGTLQMREVIPIPVVTLVAPHRATDDWTRQVLLNRIPNAHAMASESRVTRWLVRRAALRHMRIDRDWQWALRLGARLKSDDKRLLATLDQLFDQASDAEVREMLGTLWPEAVDHNWDRVVALLDHPDVQMSGAALVQLRHGAAHGRTLPERVLDIASDLNRADRRTAMYTIRLFADVPDETEPTLYRLLDDPQFDMVGLAAIELNRRDPAAFNAYLSGITRDQEHPHYEIAGTLAPLLLAPSIDAARALASAADLRWTRLFSVQRGSRMNLDMWLQDPSLSVMERHAIIHELASSGDPLVISQVIPLLYELPANHLERIERDTRLHRRVRDAAAEARLAIP